MFIFLQLHVPAAVESQDSSWMFGFQSQGVPSLPLGPELDVMVTSSLKVCRVSRATTCPPHATRLSRDLPWLSSPPHSSPRAARAPTRRRHRPRNSCLLPSSHQSTNNHPPLVCVCVLPSWSRDHYSAGIGTPFYSAAGLHQPVY